MCAVGLVAKLASKDQKKKWGESDMNEHKAAKVARKIREKRWKRIKKENWKLNTAIIRIPKTMNGKEERRRRRRGHHVTKRGNQYVVVKPQVDNHPVIKFGLWYAGNFGNRRKPSPHGREYWPDE